MSHRLYEERVKVNCADLVTVPLTEEHVQPALLRGVTAQDDHGDEAQSGSRLPDLEGVTQ